MKNWDHLKDLTKDELIQRVIVGEGNQYNLSKAWEEMKQRAERAEARLRECLWHANAMANMIRGFIFKTVERETLAEVAAKYRKWEEDDCHRTWRAGR